MRQLNRYIVAVFVSGALCLTAAAAEEQLQQDTISIKGNQALPKTLYIAPWKRVGAPLESGRIDGEIREQSKPVERDMFQRQLQLQREGYSID
ncbi:MAG: hypothetical protein OEU78_00665 [Gammaproteobacteria bacterium]|nr:hypothetical protein [Gammaproteobacteria bacterium]MDH3971931.1 hypothetical protein [Gammaproteobacteria bacterium]